MGDKCFMGRMDFLITFPECCNGIGVTTMDRMGFLLHQKLQELLWVQVVHRDHTMILKFKVHYIQRNLPADSPMIDSSIGVSNNVMHFLWLKFPTHFQHGALPYRLTCFRWDLGRARTGPTLPTNAGEFLLSMNGWLIKWFTSTCLGTWLHQAQLGNLTPSATASANASETGPWLFPWSFTWPSQQWRQKGMVPNGTWKGIAVGKVYTHAQCQWLQRSALFFFPDL